MRLRIPVPTLMAGLVAGCATAATLLPAPAFAAAQSATGDKPAAASSPVVPQSPVVPGAEQPGTAAAPLSAAELTRAQMTQPVGTAQRLTQRPTGKPAASANTRTATAQSCTPADFGSRSGSDLVSFIQGSTTDCVGGLVNVTGSDASSIFKESQMLTVAKAFAQQAHHYDGTNSSNIWQLAVFLQAGYQVQSANAATVGGYDAALTAAVQGGLDAFFGSKHWTDVTDANGAVLSDVLVLTNSANLQARYLDVYNRVLTGYNASWNASPKMVAAVDAVLSAPLWLGNANTAFTSAIAAHPQLIKNLAAFVLGHRDLLGTANSGLELDAGNALARMAGDGPAVEALVKPQLKAALDAVTVTGPTGPLYVHLAWNADNYDNAQCGYYGTCDLPAKLTTAVLPHQLVCDNRTLEGESLSAADLQAVCTSLRGEDTFFHNLVKDNGPVNPYGKTITLAVFSNATDYQNYSWAIFGNDTNNGGETVMDPTDPTNQPVSVMYQKSWNDSFPANVWNLNHEYTHYLDGIYDMKGNFGTEISVPDIWWIEGVAEYESYTYRGLTDTQAMGEAAKHTYKLSTIFQNTYDNSDSIRTYPWGYLAVRYMFEKHPDVIQSMLGHFRTGDYTGGYAVYNSIGTAYDADFDAWLNACAAGACYADGPTALFTSTVNGATVSLTDTSVLHDSTSPITKWHWTFGDGTSSDERNPSHTYAAAGTYTVAETVTDANGKSDSTPTSVTVTTGAGTTLPTCTDPRTDALGQNCARPNQSATAGNIDYLYVYLPAGTSTLKVSTSGGTGSAFLYYDDKTWASPKTFTASSTSPGTSQSITVTNPTAGYRYISLYAATDFTGVTVSTQF
ncbi:collagenase [Kitasatospora viridis]|uniref:microbial collagenase n=1 Tax=Kitasatospora viridis TaxID=281105 RepID=A0A561TT74_9ACTN|nr:collagenase [Kitasatospora viridis]TWF90322.1 microbial collagenase [Kitasatospora viridis]